MTTPFLELYREIPLSKGKTAFVSEQDYERLSGYRWFSHLRSGNWYAHRNGPTLEGKRAFVMMHHDVIGKPVTGIVTDHINGNSLDNRRSNLRHASYSENARNRKTRRTSTTGLKGVSPKKDNGKWTASIYVSGKRKHLGVFSTPQEAHVAYCEAASKFYGEFARTA